MLIENEIIKTESEIRNGIKYTTHYINRAIRQGDPSGNAKGYSSPDHKDVTTEIVKYVYQPLTKA